MFFDILPVFVLSLFSSLFLCTTSVHGLPSPSPSSISSATTADLSSNLRFLHSRPILNVEHPPSDGDDDSSSSLELYSSSNSNWLFDKLFEEQRQRKRSPTSYHLRTDTSSLSKGDSTSNFNQIDEPIRLSPSLKTLIETNPFARAWLTMLLQKLMQEQHVPYIFKYGRRRK